MNAEQPASAISIKGLRKVFVTGVLRRKYVALDSLDLEVPKGIIFGYVGHNGAGKTTSIKMLMGLITPTAGKAEVLGRPIKHMEALARIGFLPEHPYFHDYLTGREFLDFYARLFDIPAAERARRIDRLIGEVRLERAVDAQLRTYSKGMLQRIGVAQALINDPQLVILDEPMSGLDPAGRRLIRNLIIRMRDEGRTVFFSSHILSDVEMICDRIGILVRGKLAYTGGVNELLEQHTERVEVRVEQLPESFAAEQDGLLVDAVQHGTQWLLKVNADRSQQLLLQRLTEAGAEVIAVNPVRPSLEELFMREMSGDSAAPPPQEGEASP